MQIDLKGRRALVSGSTAGIGYAVAKGLAEAGATVIVNGRTEERVESALATLRKQVPGAQLLGFANFAELSLETKMAESPDAVEKFLLELTAKAKPYAQAELDELRAYARKRDGLEDFQPWDAAYYSEKLKEEKLGFSEEELRPYFPAAQAIQGMFTLVERLYGVKIEAVSGVPVWHKDVTTYALREADGTDIGLFYLDPYARQDKRGGAWMDECLGRRRTPSGLQRPVAYLTCNFAPPLGSDPALLTHDEVLTLFHEFGHGLHGLLSDVDHERLSGTQVLRDFIHVEAVCAPNSVILMHDTVPADEITQRPNRERGFYTGDVWKIVPCLKHFRPDLKIWTVATPWSGLTVVGGIDPTSTVLKDKYEEAVAMFGEMPYEHLAADLNGTLNMVENDWPVMLGLLKGVGVVRQEEPAL